MTSTISTDNLKLTNPLAEIYGGTGQSTYTTGDLLYASGTNQLSKLAIGNTGYVLTSTGTVPVYSPLIPTSETLILSSVSTPITPSIDYTYLNCTGGGNGLWATRMAGTGNETGYSITTDSTGMYVAGKYNNIPMTIYNYDGTPFGTLPGPGTYQFIVKYNTSGVGQWSARIGNITGDSLVKSIITDSTGIYMVGWYYTSALLTIYNSDTSVFGTLSNSSSNYDGFIVKYNTLGFAQWATKISGTAVDVINCVTTDSTGVYVTGQHNSNPATIYNSDGTVFGTLLATPGTDDAFTVKYNTAGYGQWATRIICNSIVAGYSMATDSTGVYATGYYSTSSITIYNSDTTVFGTLVNSGDYDTYIVKYNTSGFVLWATRIADTGTDQSYSITTDSTGIYVTGQYSSNTLTIYNSDTTIFGTLTNTGGTDAYIVKYNTSGFAQWATRIGSTNLTSYSIGNSINASSSGVYVTGAYGDVPVTIYNSDTTVFGTLTNTGANSGVFVVKYNRTGFAKWAARIAGNSSNIGYSITTDSTGIYVTGSYDNSVSTTVYNSDTTVFQTLVNSGLTDTFIVKYRDLINLASLANRTLVGSKVISMLNDGVVDITVSNLVHNGVTMTTLTLDLKGETVELGWNGTYWFVVSNNGAVVS